MEELLRAHEEAGQFLKGKSDAMAATIDTPPIAEGPGQTIDCYKLLQEIGEGGFGV